MIFFSFRFMLFYFLIMRMQDVTDPLDLSTIKRKKKSHKCTALFASESVSTLFTVNKGSRISGERARDLGFLATVAVQGADGESFLTALHFFPAFIFFSFHPKEADLLSIH